jgi:hypothetical protein
MIRYRVETETGIIDGLEEWLRFVGDDVYALNTRILNQLRPQMLQELQTYPGRVKYPIQWTSDRQRRAFFASNGFGAGIPYRRTNALARGWNIQAHRKGDGRTDIVIDNYAKYARFVVGTLSGNPQRATVPMQRFHRNTGWFPAGQTVAFWVQAWQEEFERGFRSEVAPAATAPTIRRFAVTPRLGRQ